jgi:putative DNA primase/helicase
MLNTENSTSDDGPKAGRSSDSIFLKDSMHSGLSNFCRPIIENIPNEMKKLPQWVLWKFELDKNNRWTKVPYHPKPYRASSNKPRTWSTFKAVWIAYQAGGFDGVGFVFSENDEFIGIDLDHIFDADGNVKESEPWALDVLEQLKGSYTELSPSGEGLHIIVRGSLPEPGGNDGKPGGQPHLEIYQSGRYFTITGHLWSNDNADN